MRTIVSLGVERTFSERYIGALAQVRRIRVINTVARMASAGVALSETAGAARRGALPTKQHRLGGASAVSPSSAVVPTSRPLMVLLMVLTSWPTRPAASSTVAPAPAIAFTHSGTGPTPSSAASAAQKCTQLRWQRS